MNAMKRTVSALLIIILLSALFTACGAGGNVTSLVFSRPGEVALEVGQSDYGGYLLVSAKKKSDFSPEQVEFISENPEVATIEYKNDALTTYLYYEITGVGAGETFVYAVSRESGVASEKIKVTVTGPDLPTSPAPQKTEKPSGSDGAPTEPTPPTTGSALSAETEPFAPSISAEPTETPSPTSDAPTEPAGNALQLVKMDKTVARGEKTTLSIQGLPGETYGIKVYYSASVSKASGLEDKAADKDGNVSWTWRVGSQTKPGEHKIVISGGGETLTVYCTTTE